MKLDAKKHLSKAKRLMTNMRGGNEILDERIV